MRDFVRRFGAFWDTHLAKAGNKAFTAGAQRVILVHGLGSSTRKTWAKMRAVALAESDLAALNIDTFEYPTAKIWLGIKRRTPSIQELAAALKEALQLEGAAPRDFIVVAHSLGGLVAMECALQCVEQGITPPAALLLYAVPEIGSQFASAVQGLQPQNTQVGQLSIDSTYLDALRQRWADYEMEHRVRTLRVSGGMDGIAPTTLAAQDPSIRRRTLMGRDHNNIVVPKDRADITFEIFKSFLLQSDEQHLNGGLPQQADPLFDIYSPRHEAFYLERSADVHLRQALSRGSTWILGASGLGKTVAIRRNAYIAGWRIRNVLLGGLQDATAIQLLRAMYQEIADQIGEPNAPPPETSHQILTAIRHVLRRDLGASISAIFVDEIPLSDANVSAEFIHLILELSLSIETDPSLSGRVALAFATIAPPQIGNADVSKFWERFRPVRLDCWTTAEMEALLDCLLPSLNLDLQKVEQSRLVAVSEGRPRVLKKILSRSLHTPEAERDFERAIAQVLMEEG